MPLWCETLYSLNITKRKTCKWDKLSFQKPEIHRTQQSWRLLFPGGFSPICPFLLINIIFRLTVYIYWKHFMTSIPFNWASIITIFNCQHWDSWFPSTMFTLFLDREQHINIKEASRQLISGLLSGTCLASSSLLLSCSVCGAQRLTRSRFREKAFPMEVKTSLKRLMRQTKFLFSNRTTGTDQALTSQPDVWLQSKQITSFPTKVAQAEGLQQKRYLELPC